MSLMTYFPRRNDSENTENDYLRVTKYNKTNKTIKLRYYINVYL